MPGFYFMMTHTGFLHRLLFPSMLWRMPGQNIYLTFDDGPHADATPVVLEKLRYHNVPATFFLSGKNISGLEHLVKEIHTQGHSIGIHAYHHTRALAFSKERTINEIRETEKLVSAIVPVKCRLFRPPFGFFSWNTIRAVRALGYYLVMWSVIPGDFRKRPVSGIVSTALRRLSGGSIIVLHDNHLTAESIGALLDELIPAIKNRGFTFGAIR